MKLSKGMLGDLACRWKAPRHTRAADTPARKARANLARGVHTLSKHRLGWSINGSRKTGRRADSWSAVRAPKISHSKLVSIGITGICLGGSSAKWTRVWAGGGEYHRGRRGLGLAVGRRTNSGAAVGTGRGGSETVGRDSPTHQSHKSPAAWPQLPIQFRHQVSRDPVLMHDSSETDVECPKVHGQVQPIQSTNEGPQQCNATTTACTDWKQCKWQRLLHR